MAAGKQLLPIFRQSKVVPAGLVSNQKMKFLIEHTMSNFIYQNHETKSTKDFPYATVMRMVLKWHEFHFVARSQDGGRSQFKAGTGETLQILSWR